jgi:anti-sigma28 factor (negative regulator of flagellin synthesis)
VTNGINPYAAGLSGPASRPNAEPSGNAARAATDQSPAPVEGTQAVATSAATQPAASVAAGLDSVQLSEKGQIAQALLEGAAAAADEPPGAAVTSIARQIAAGTYRPSSQAIANALIEYETTGRQSGG